MAAFKAPRIKRFCRAHALLANWNLSFFSRLGTLLCSRKGREFFFQVLLRQILTISCIVKFCRNTASSGLQNGFWSTTKLNYKKKNKARMFPLKSTLPWKPTSQLDVHSRVVNSTDYRQGKHRKGPSSSSAPWKENRFGCQSSTLSLRKRNTAILVQQGPVDQFLNRQQTCSFQERKLGEKMQLFQVWLWGTSLWSLYVGLSGRDLQTSVGFKKSIFQFKSILIWIIRHRFIKCQDQSFNIAMSFPVYGLFPWMCEALTSSRFFTQHDLTMWETSESQLNHKTCQKLLH